MLAIAIASWDMNSASAEVALSRVANVALIKKTTGALVAGEEVVVGLGVGRVTVEIDPVMVPR